MPKGYRNYEEGLLEALQDPREAANYLNACLEGGSREVFLLALRQVAEAHSMSKIAAQADLGRETLYRTLSRRGNPRLDTLIRLLSAAGLRLSVETGGSPMKAQRRRVA
jgi:probable addiction module antidote protein